MKSKAKKKVVDGRGEVRSRRRRNQSKSTGEMRGVDGGGEEERYR